MLLVSLGTYAKTTRPFTTPNDVHESNGLEICRGPCTIAYAILKVSKARAYQLDIFSPFDFRPDILIHTRNVYRNVIPQSNHTKQLNYIRVAWKFVEFVCFCLVFVVVVAVLMLNVALCLLFFFITTIFIASAVLLQTKMQSSRFIIQFRRFVLAPSGLIRLFFPYRLWIVCVCRCCFFLFRFSMEQSTSAVICLKIHTPNSK